MSIEALSAVKPRQTGNASRKAVLLVLADYADELWSCWPSQQRLADETELGVRTVRRVLAELEDAGLIHRKMRRGEGGHRSSDRIVLVESAIRSLPAKVAARTQAQAATDDSQPANHDAQAATDDTSNRPQEPGNSHLNGQVELSERTALVLVVANPDFEAFWEQYPRREGIKQGKDTARKKWGKLSHDERLAVMVAMPNYVAGIGGYPKDPPAFLNQRIWEDWQEPAVPNSTRIDKQAQAFRDFTADG